ncbi:sugar transferase [Staphylococcus kloosii]|uniref:Sugar transferase n=1 Tax=Staphylococcus kloosii TaxID=29384 RepID=A0ABQ0XIG1_9STAP|nr:sugar transferase [Staphylococcus kloosii]AVQ35872.1 sugar transferase [Staphylococcus kloosii]PNZ04295.1 sugar transferase [Staphylococcus kloosii]GEP81140.1 sugar transferase [Staphylococcus kloosii]SUM48944.1 capsular polysaccharide synthesis enzyme Cap5M [Staphylococcus kloosii]
MKKRALDFIISVLGLTLTSPMILIFAVLIRLNMGKPVFYKQIRPGKNEVPFTLIKFRTMTNQQDLNGVLLPDELRKTRLGSFIRSTSIDELPQLYNVLKGDLSIVGPRPLLMEYLTLYNAKQRLRHVVKPGITGLAQIKGRNALSWEHKFKYDVWYVKNQSMKLDLYIIFMTIIKVVLRKNVNAQNHATMYKFKGTKL